MADAADLNFALERGVGSTPTGGTQYGDGNIMSHFKRGDIIMISHPLVANHPMVAEISAVSDNYYIVTNGCQSWRISTVKSFAKLTPHVQDPTLFDQVVRVYNG